MAHISITPLTEADIAEFTTKKYGAPQRPSCRLRGVAGRVDGEILGYGGFATTETGGRQGFCDLLEEARNYPIALTRAAMRAISAADRLGVERIIATLGPTPAAERWLFYLGFTIESAGETTVYVRTRPKI